MAKSILHSESSVVEKLQMRIIHSSSLVIKKESGKENLREQ